MSRDTAISFDPGNSGTRPCAHCADPGVLVRVLRCMADARAWCEDEHGRPGVVATAFVADVQPGDVLVVHQGVAVARVQSGEDA